MNWKKQDFFLLDFVDVWNGLMKTVITRILKTIRPDISSHRGDATAVAV